MRPDACVVAPKLLADREPDTEGSVADCGWGIERKKNELVSAKELLRFCSVEPLSINSHHQRGCLRRVDPLPPLRRHCKPSAVVQKRPVLVLAPLDGLLILR